MTEDIRELKSSILARVMANGTLSPSVAHELLKWGFTQSDQDRMKELAAKARSGSLNAEERVEVDEYEWVSSFLGILKSKARRSLQNVKG